MQVHSKEGAIGSEGLVITDELPIASHNIDIIDILSRTVYQPKLTNCCGTAWSYNTFSVVFNNEPRACKSWHRTPTCTAQKLLRKWLSRKILHYKVINN